MNCKNAVIKIRLKNRLSFLLKLKRKLKRFFNAIESPPRSPTQPMRARAAGVLFCQSKFPRLPLSSLTSLFASFLLRITRQHDENYTYKAVHRIAAD